MKPWRKKAHREIGKLCLTSYKQSNQKKDGTYQKRHVSYSVPQLAEELIQCLNTNNELRAKQIFVYEL